MRKVRLSADRPRPGRGNKHEVDAIDFEILVGYTAHDEAAARDFARAAAEGLRAAGWRADPSLVSDNEEPL